MPRLLALLLALLLPLLGAPADAAPRRQKVRVLSWNVWGLPWGLSKQREERIAAIGARLGELKLDLVLLQEVWVAEDGVALGKALAAAGLSHQVHESEGFLGSGLLIASRWPISGSDYQAFELSGKLHKPWNGDAWTRKGFLELQLDTPLGRLVVVDTHLHASYGGGEYEPVQTAQALQLSSALGDLGARPPPQRDDAARPPLLLAGDLNVELGTLPFELLRRRCDLRPAKPTLGGIDWILLRDGGGLRWRVKRVEHALTEEVELPGGTRPLSDHPAVLAELELLRGAPARWQPQQRQREWLSVAREAHPWLVAQRDRAGVLSGRWTRRALLLLLIGGALLWAGQKRKEKRGHCLLAVASLLLLHLAVWAMYLGVVHHRLEEAGLSAALSRARDGAPDASPAPTPR